MDLFSIIKDVCIFDNQEKHNDCFYKNQKKSPNFCFQESEIFC